MFTATVSHGPRFLERELDIYVSILFTLCRSLSPSLVQQICHDSPPQGRRGRGIIMLLQPRLAQFWRLILLCCLGIVFLVFLSRETIRYLRIQQTRSLNTVPRPEHVEKALVMGKMKGERVRWAHELRPE